MKLDELLCPKCGRWTESINGKRVCTKCAAAKGGVDSPKKSTGSSKDPSQPPRKSRQMTK